MIKKLRLKNWKCHLNSEFEFALGTNALLGVMGAGKSSVLDAISFALFGTFPALHQRKLKLEDAIMKKPVRKDFAEVELEFDFNGSVYTIKRRIEKRRATQAELRINGKLVEAQPQRVNEFIENIIKMDFDLFTRAIYSEQNRIDAFLNLPKGQRIKKIDEILKLERFEQARASVVSLVNRFKDLNKELTRFISTLGSEVNEKEMEILKKDIEDITKDLEEMEKTSLSLQNSLEKVESEKREMIELRNRKTTVEKELHATSSQIEMLKKQIKEKSLPSLEEVKKKISEVLEKLEEVGKVDEELKKRIRDMKRKKDEIEITLREIKENREKLETLKKEKKDSEEVVKKLPFVKKELETLKAKLDEKRKQCFSLSTRVKEIEKSLEELSKISTTCPVCDSELSEEKKEILIQKKRNELEELRDKVLASEKEGKELEKRIKELEKSYFELNALQERVKDLNVEIEKLTNRVKEEEHLQKEYDLLKKEIEEIESKNREIEEKIHFLKVELEKSKILEEQVIELENKKKQLEEKEKKAKELEEELEKLKKLFSEEKLEKLIEESKELFGKLSSIKAKINEMHKLKNEKIKRMKEMEKKLKDLKKYQEEKLKVEQIISDLEKLKEALLHTQKELRKNFISAVNQAMQAIWEELYPYGDFQSIRLSVQEGDYILQLQELDGTWVSAEHVSGGERTLAALTLRIAFALVLAPQLRWLILDEPTHNLDVKAREELARVLRERITEFIDQVFLITHDPILEDAVSGVLYKIEREKEKNGVAKVIRVEER